MNNNDKEFDYQDMSDSSRKNWQIGSTDLKEVKESYCVGTPQKVSGNDTFITIPSLDAEEMYKVGTIGYQNGGTTIISTKTADTTNSDVNTLDTIANGVNQSAKWKTRTQSTSQMPGEPSGDEPSI